MSGSVFQITAEGNGPIAASHTIDSGNTHRLVSVSCVFNAAPTSSENYTITLNSVHGPAFDLLLYTLDPSAGSTTDILWQPPEEIICIGGDAIDVEFDNTDTNEWGVIFTMKRV